jgi:hypothetical protein
MIIGHGDLASVIREKDRSDRLFFFSGVSNSAETDVSAYQREISLLLEQDVSSHLVYCSSLCVFYADTAYAHHKRMMEELIKKTFKHYTIIRIGNITWGTNPHTILNFFREKIRKGEEFEIRDVYRYLVDKDEFLYWIGMIPDWSCEMNIVGKTMKVQEIVDMIKKEKPVTESESLFKRMPIRH